MNWYKKIISVMCPQEDKVKNLAKKIMSGEKEWSPEDLQLYQNNRELIEDLLKKEAI